LFKYLLKYLLKYLGKLDLGLAIMHVMGKAVKLREAATEVQESDVVLRLWLAISHLRSRLRAEAGSRSAGYSITQLAILQRLLEGPLTAAELAENQHVSQQAIAQNVAVLEAASLVERARDGRDRRKVLIAATDAGRELLEASRASRKAWLFRAIEEVVGADEREDLVKTIDLLERLAGADARGH
jgi:DNA-binding MarR family transcriptional regulator